MSAPFDRPRFQGPNRARGGAPMRATERPITLPIAPVDLGLILDLGFWGVPAALPTSYMAMIREEAQRGRRGPVGPAPNPTVTARGKIVPIGAGAGGTLPGGGVDPGIEGWVRRTFPTFSDRQVREEVAYRDRLRRQAELDARRRVGARDYDGPGPDRPRSETLVGKLENLVGSAARAQGTFFPTGPAAVARSPQERLPISREVPGVREEVDKGREQLASPSAPAPVRFLQQLWSALGGG